MSDENEQAEKTPEAKSAKSGGLDFGAVIAKLKDLGSFLSLDGKASRSEYWATFLILWLPLALLSGVFTTLALVLDPSKDQKGFLPVLFSYPMALFTALATACLVIANLVMFPVLMRRLRDAKISAWLAAGCFAVAAVPFPWFGYAGALIVLAAGIFPSRVDADAISAAGITEKAKMNSLSVLFFVLAAVMSGSMMSYFTAWYQVRAANNEIEKNIDKAKDAAKEASDKLKRDMEKGMGGTFGDGSFDDESSGRGRKSRGWGHRESKSEGAASARRVKAVSASDSSAVSRYESFLRRMAKEAPGALSESDIQQALRDFKNSSPAKQREILSNTDLMQKSFNNR